MCIVHGYIPNSCLTQQYFRCATTRMGICLAYQITDQWQKPVLSKLLEHFILSSTFPFLGTTDNQFRFKAGHSSDQCTFLLSKIASYLVIHGSHVHAVFLDASKAFDRILRMKLFEKLIQRKVKCVLCAY